MTRIVYFILILTCLTSCRRVLHFSTDENGDRVKNPKRFTYNKPKYTTRDKGGIDTTAIYLLDSTQSQYKEQWRKRNAFCRFFSGGQVVFILCENIPSSDLVNNKKSGTPGYYYIEDDKIRISLYENLNGGQIGGYFGRILPNGNIMFYEERPSLYYGSFGALHRQARRSFWEKIKVDGLKSYKPDW
jgi:hypothetical protein